MLRPPFVFLLALFAAVSLPAYGAVSQATFLFLAIPPSPQANGMGGALTLMGTDDPLAVMINPASLGVAAQSRVLGTAFYPLRTNWLPEFSLSDISYSTRAFMVGASAERLLHKHALPVHFGIGYEEVYLDLGTTQRRGSENEPLGTFGSWERARGFTVAASLSRPVIASFGWTFKHADSHLWSSDGTAMQGGEAEAPLQDFGFLLAVPALNYVHAAFLERAHLRPHFTPMYSYSITNIGGDVSYTDRAQGDPLPRTVHATIGVSTGVTMETSVGSWRMADLELAVQGEDQLIWRDSFGQYNYRRSLGDLDVVHDLLFGGSNQKIDKRYGWEVGMLDLVTIRNGRFEQQDQDWGYETNGFSLKLSGLLHMITHASMVNPANQVVPFLIQHVDLQYSESKWNVFGGYSPSDDTRFRQLSLYLR